MVARWESGISPSKNERQLLVARAGETEVGLDAAKSAMADALSYTFRTLESHGIRCHLMLQVPHQLSNPHRRLMRSLLNGKGVPRGISIEDHIARHRLINQFIDNATSSTRTIIINPSPSFFPDEGGSLIGDSRGSYYVDDDHVSAYGARTMCLPTIIDMLRRITQR
jgi:hypothetical protein